MQMESRPSDATAQVVSPEAAGEVETNVFGKPPEFLPQWVPAPPSRVDDFAGVELVVIDLNRKADRKLFLDMAKPIYAGDPQFVMPLYFERMKFLDPQQNVGLSGLEILPLLAKQNGKVVGRITAHIDRDYDAYHQTKAGWFGFFECINDRKVAHALFDRATRWLRDKGAVEVIGPMNFTTNHQAGMLVQNFDRPPAVEMTYNPRYYQELVESYGFGKAKDLYAWWIDVSDGIENQKVARIHKIAQRIASKQGVKLRTLKMKDFNAEAERLFELYNRAWQKNWGFVPLNREKFFHQVKDLKDVADERLIFFIEVNGSPVAFCCTLPDINEALPKDGKLFPLGWLEFLRNRKKIKHARLFTLGVLPEYRKRGLETLLFIETAVRAKELGFHSGEIGWTLEDNVLINKAIEQMDGRLDRIYRLYGFDLRNEARA
jgi:GNAT superfamily N-acetyltransferase